jgi:hypothetical protein
MTRKRSLLPGDSVGEAARQPVLLTESGISHPLSVGLQPSASGLRLAVGPGPLETVFLPAELTTTAGRATGIRNVQ